MSENISSKQTASGKKYGAKKIACIVAGGIGAAIALFVIIVLCWLVVVKYIKREPVPFVMGYASLYVATGSMTGTIDQGSIVLVKRTGSYEVGDIITFLPKGDVAPTTHRIIDIHDGLYYTKGDYNNSADLSPITYNEICGEVVKVLPKAGLFFKWLGEGGGWIFITAAVAVIIAASILWKRIGVTPPATGGKQSDSAENINSSEQAQNVEADSNAEGDSEAKEDTVALTDKADEPTQTGTTEGTQDGKTP